MSEQYKLKFFSGAGKYEVSESAERAATEIAQGLNGVTADKILGTIATLNKEFGEERKALLRKRDDLQDQINTFFDGLRKDLTPEQRRDAYYSELQKIESGGTKYIVPSKEGEVKVTTKDVDADLASISGPQVVCPLWIPDTNARFPLNAVKGRWQSFFATRYGNPQYGNNNLIDITGDLAFGEKQEDGKLKYNPKRGEKVFEESYIFLDEAFKLAEGNHKDVVQYRLEDVEGKKTLVAVLKDGRTTGLADPAQFVGFKGDVNAAGDKTNPNGQPASIVLGANGLHIEMQINRTDTPTPAGNKGTDHPAGLTDIQMEGAITTILDMEDAVAAVDPTDKHHVWHNWLGIMKGDLTETFEKDGKKETRGLQDPEDHDKVFTAPDEKGEVRLKSHSTLLVRTTGMAMDTNAMLDEKGEKVPEHMADLVMAAYSALHNLDKSNDDPTKNARAGKSVYVVMPKMHGPEEVAYAVKVFARVEEEMEKAQGLEPGKLKNVLKIGIMDEEQRTSLNLKECIREASDRVVFINTGFLDRTGDLIHTAMNMGPIVPKSELQNSPENSLWLRVYEMWNSAMGLVTNLFKHGQIGKGMATKNRDPKSLLVPGRTKHSDEWGANTSWVPSPQFGPIDAERFYKKDVGKKQEELLEEFLTKGTFNGAKLNPADIVNIPLLSREELKTNEKLRKEVDDATLSYCQSILGYVVRWVNDGTGSSSVPDFSDTYLMEDRATLRIHSQLLANWLKHDIISPKQLEDAMKEAAKKVDGQNIATATRDKPYYPLFDASRDAVYANAPAYKCAMELVTKGEEAANGYVENSLHKFREEIKALDEPILAKNPVGMPGAWRRRDEALGVVRTTGVSPYALAAGA